MVHHLSLLAQYDSSDGGGGVLGCFFGVVWLAVIILIIIGFWKVFEKAGHPGWAAIIPIYNLYILCKIAGRPGWWVVLFLIPFVNFIMAIIVSLDVAKNFGKSPAFGIGLVFLGFIFYPILGFGDARYQGPLGPQGPPMTT